MFSEPINSFCGSCNVLGSRGPILFVASEFILCHFFFLFYLTEFWMFHFCRTLGNCSGLFLSNIMFSVFVYKNEDFVCVCERENDHVLRHFCLVLVQ